LIAHCAAQLASRLSKAYAVGESTATVSTRIGLTFIPDQATNTGGSIRLLPALPKAPAAHAIDRVLDGIAATCGNAAADHSRVAAA
jgi:hypothetical protein